MKKFTVSLLGLCLTFGVSSAIAGITPPTIPMDVDLIAGQFDDVGSVAVSDQGASTQVQFNASGSWRIAEAHADLDPSSDCNGTPQTGSGNPKVGKFDTQSGFALPGTAQVSLSLADTTCGGIDYCVAAHAVVYDSSLVGTPGDAGCDATTGSDGEVTDADALECSGEGAWGEGPGFSGKNWAMYFRFKTPACPI